MKKTKSAVAISLAIIMVLLSNVTAFATNTPYNTLIEKGFPREYLDTLSEDMIMEIYTYSGNNVVSSIETKSETTNLLYSR